MPALPWIPFNPYEILYRRLTPSTIPTYSGGLITDVTRNAALSGDGLTPPSGMGMWPATTPIYVFGFESGLGGWTNQGSLDNCARSSAYAKFATNSLHVGMDNQQNDFRFAQKVITTVGSTTYTLGLWEKLPASASVGSGGRVSVVINNGSSDIASFFPSTSAHDWTFHQLTFTTGVSETAENVRFVLHNVAADYYFDGVQVEPGSIATPFIGDGNSTRTAGRIQVPSSYLTAAQGWVVLYFTPQQPSSAFASTPMGLLEWWANTSNRILGYYQGGTWTSFKAGSGTSGQVSPSASWLAGDGHMVGFGWDSGHQYISVRENNYAIQSATLAAVPSSLPATFDIGNLPQNNGNVQSMSNHAWAVLLNGSPTSSDMQFLASFGQRVPPPASRLAAALSANAQPTAVVSFQQR